MFLSVRAIMRWEDPTEIFNRREVKVNTSKFRWTFCPTRINKSPLQNVSGWTENFYLNTAHAAHVTRTFHAISPRKTYEFFPKNYLQIKCSKIKKCLAESCKKESDSGRMAMQDIISLHRASMVASEQQSTIWCLRQKRRVQLSVKNTNV